MAKCEQCGKDQFPYDSKQKMDTKGVIHWFCSVKCLEEFDKGHKKVKFEPEEAFAEAPEMIVGQISVEEAVEESEAEEKAAPKERKTRGRPRKHT